MRRSSYDGVSSYDPVSRNQGGIASRASAIRRRDDPVQDHDLLPDLAGKTGGQFLDIVDGRKRDRVAEVLHVERGDLADHRKLFAAVVQITCQLEGSQRRLGR